MATFIGLKVEVQRDYYLSISCFDLHKFNKIYLHAHLIKREIMNINIKSQNHGKCGHGRR